MGLFQRIGNAAKGVRGQAAQAGKRVGQTVRAHGPGIARGTASVASRGVRAAPQVKRIEERIHGLRQQVGKATSGARKDELQREIKRIEARRRESAQERALERKLANLKAGKTTKTKRPAAKRKP